MAVVLKLVDARGIQIKGESTLTGHIGEIDVVAWNWGVTAPVGVKLDILDMSIQKSFDLASPIILAKTTNNEILQLGVLTAIDQQGMDKLVVTFKKIKVESLNIVEKPMEYPPTENISFRFDEIEFKYQGEDVVVRRPATLGRRKITAKRKL